MTRSLDTLGRLIFRLRGVLPLPLIFLSVQAVWDDHVRPTPPLDAALNQVGLLCCVLGEALRFITVGQAPPGASSESRVVQAASLSTAGVYSLVRHPLYVGNFFITVGLLCIVHEPLTWALGLSYWAVTHALIVRVEEQHLAHRFPADFERWRAEVPGWVPRLSGFRATGRPFGWKRAIQREINPLVAWGLGATLLLGWERFVRSELPAAEGRWYVRVMVAFLVLLIANKVWKKVSRA